MTAQQLVAAMLVIVSLLYSAAAVGYLMDGRPGMAAAFAGYVAANLGLIYDALRHGGAP